MVILLEDSLLDEREVEVAKKYDSARLMYNVNWVPEVEDVEPLASLCGKVLKTRWWSRSWLSPSHSLFLLAAR